MKFDSFLAPLLAAFHYDHRSFVARSRLLKASSSYFQAENFLHGLPSKNETSAVRGIDPSQLLLQPTMTSPVCRIVARADGKLPTTTEEGLPVSVANDPAFLDGLDALYNAQAHQRCKSLSYMKPNQATEGFLQEDPQLVPTVRNCLEDAGFQLLSRRDLDLCESLNVGYLFRLSIVPDVSDLDASIVKEFYPEKFSGNGTVQDKDELLFDGRVLVYWRGYSQEVTEDRLWLRKLDYLQASLVQRSVAWVKRKLNALDGKVAESFDARRSKLKTTAKRKAREIAESVGIKNVTGVRTDLTKLKENMGRLLPTKQAPGSSPGKFKLARYGGSKVRFVGSPNPSDALDPFTICEVAPTQEQHDSRGAMDADSESGFPVTLPAGETLTCEYDERMPRNQPNDKLPKMQLLERVDLSSLIDVFSKRGRRKLIEAIVDKSRLVEPTYGEVCVVWRPSPKQKSAVYPPRVVTELADMFDIEGFEGPPDEKPITRPEELEIRNFEDVPMSNLPAVLPKTKLIFRPADALLNDLISVITLILVTSSVRLDSPRLDLLALISVTLWTIRTVIRYSNKLARYDLLVKTFLTSKLSHRNSGALKYLASDAGSQRAVRTALTRKWAAAVTGSRKEKSPSTREELQDCCEDGINTLLSSPRLVRVDTNQAIQDLETLDILRFSEQGTCTQVRDTNESMPLLKQSWIQSFQGAIKRSRRTTDIVYHIPLAEEETSSTMDA